MKAADIVSKTPIAIIASMVLYKAFHYHGYQAIVVEDGLVENLTSLSYFAAGVVSSLIAHRLFRSQLYPTVYTYAFVLLTIGLLVIAFEEVSWGQRFFGIDTPENLKKINVQGEITFHNLPPFHHYITMNAYILIGFYGSFGWLIAKRLHLNNRLLLPQQESFLYFVPILLSALYLEYIRAIALKVFDLRLEETLYFIETIDNEVSEMILGFGFLVFLVYTYAYLQRLTKTGTQASFKKWPDKYANSSC